MVLIPVNRYQIIRQCRNFKKILSTTSSIIHFSVEQKFRKHHFQGLLNNKLQRETIIYYFIYSGARKVKFRKIMQQNYFEEI